MKTRLLPLLTLAVCALASFGHAEVIENAAGMTIQRGTANPLAFHGSTPVIQRASADQAAVTKTTGTALATTAVTQSTPWGFASQAQGDALTTRVNQLVADNAALVTLVNELRAALVAKGLIKGSN